MKILLDTQLAIWWQIAPDRINSTTKKLLTEEADEIFLSRASLWEMAIKVNAGKLHLDLPWFVERSEADGFCWLGIESAHILTYATLPMFDDHKDPFDRLLAAQSITEPLIFVTTDRKLTRYGSTVRVV